MLLNNHHHDINGRHGGFRSPKGLPQPSTITIPGDGIAPSLADNPAQPGMSHFILTSIDDQVFAPGAALADEDALILRLGAQPLR